ncbi:hypothetical protein HK096_005676 [Nowakowskiella sp. JEL0078]|nr:hypothetical protein HK096_005676 [Nowakowskiella sp. JEL0078]
MGFSFQDIPDLAGKVAIVTGGNSGLGFITVTELARKNAKVYLAARSRAKFDSALEEIKITLPQANIVFLELDLGDLKQARNAALKFLNTEERLDILVNNAGIWDTPFRLSKDGFEEQFAVNHLGPFAFTVPLLPLLKKSAPSRIVNLSSELYLFAPKEGILFDRLNDESALIGKRRYAQSKLANILFTKSLAEFFENEEVFVNAVHPGIVNTNLFATKNNYRTVSEKIIGLVVDFFVGLTKVEPAEGSLNQLYAATSEEIISKNIRGAYLVPVGKLGKELKIVESKELRDKLWKFSEDIIVNLK